MTHLSAEQKQEFETSYQQLDTLFESEQPNEAQYKKINALFDKIDSIFTSAEKSLSPNEQDTLSKLEVKLIIFYNLAITNSVKEIKIK